MSERPKLNAKNPPSNASRGPWAVKIRSPKASELVADHIRKLILRGELKDGDFLPPESQLTQTFQVSRPTLREACRILESEQFISVVRGSRTGARIHVPVVENVARYAGFLLQAQRTRVSDLYEARLIVEPYTASSLAARASSADVTALRATLDEIRRLLKDPDRSRFLASTSLFHSKLLSLHGNRALALLGELLRELIMAHQSMSGTHDSASDAEFRKRSERGLRSMEKLTDLIEAGDVEGAGTHWRRHLENANKLWLDGQERSTLLDLLPV